MEQKYYIIITIIIIIIYYTFTKNNNKLKCYVYTKYMNSNVKIWTNKPFIIDNGIYDTDENGIAIIYLNNNFEIDDKDLYSTPIYYEYDKNTNKLYVNTITTTNENEIKLLHISERHLIGEEESEHDDNHITKTLEKLENMEHRRNERYDYDLE